MRSCTTRRCIPQRLAIIGGILPDVFLALGFVAHSLENFIHSATAAALHALLHHSTLHTATARHHWWHPTRCILSPGLCGALSRKFHTLCCGCGTPCALAPLDVAYRDGSPSLVASYPMYS